MANACRTGCVGCFSAAIAAALALTLFSKWIFARSISRPETFEAKFMPSMKDSIEFTWFDYRGYVGGGIGMAEGTIVGEIPPGVLGAPVLGSLPDETAGWEPGAVVLCPLQSEDVRNSAKAAAFIAREKAESFPAWICGKTHSGEWRMHEFTDPNRKARKPGIRDQAYMLVETKNPRHFVFWVIDP